jgi:hypothetical protein
MRTYSATARDAEESREWFVVDATGRTWAVWRPKLRLC